MKTGISKIVSETETAVRELIEIAKLKKGDVLVIGCSSSEVIGETIGKNSSYPVAEAIFDTAYRLLSEKGIFLAAQCCEHLNRALVIERTLAEKKNYEIVCVKPQPHAGGSFATVAFEKMKDSVVVEHIQADAGIDIGGTLIGMHLHDVAVPVRLSLKQIGCAAILCARTRPKFIGGARAQYPDNTVR